MSVSPQVSVVVPTRNRRPVLARCLEALARQTHGSFEVIVVDDGSSDDTPEYLRRFGEERREFAFQWFHNHPQAGANPSRNRGIRESRGEFVAFLDDDCIARPDWLERLVSGFASDRVAAVTGRALDPQPDNIYELALKGTHRVHGRIHATRLVGCNMCIRRDLLLTHMFDEDRAGPSSDVSVSGRGDEDGLFLVLRAAGFEQRVVHDAVVLHEHHHSRRTFFRQAYRGGRSTARLGRKYHLAPRVELAPLALAYVSLPLIRFGPAWVAPPALFAGLFMAAILYNDLVRKRKTLLETLFSFPALLAYYHARLAGYLVQHARFLVGKDRIERVRLR